MATLSSNLAWRIHGQRSLAGYSPWGCKESGMTEQLSLTHSYVILHRCLGVWLPVIQNRPRELSRHTLLEMHAYFAHSTKYYFEKIQAFYWAPYCHWNGIIAITTTAAMAGIALHQSVQTTTFVQEWHRKCQLCLGSQSHTNEINHRLVFIENTVLLLGEV